MSRKSHTKQRLKGCRIAYQDLSAKLAEIGCIWPGTIVRQRLTCGKKRCACHTDRDRRHGPYVYWTTKTRGRTVSRLLKPEEAVLYNEWITNRRRLEGIQKKMYKLSRELAKLMLEESAGSNHL